MAVFMWGAVVAVIDRGPRQAFAIGLVLIMMIYAVLVRNRVPPTGALKIVHCWWTLLLGYIDGQFAQFVYIRRVNELPAKVLTA
jgi:hypothetical protein